MSLLQEKRFKKILECVKKIVKTHKFFLYKLLQLPIAAVTSSGHFFPRILNIAKKSDLGYIIHRKAL